MPSGDRLAPAVLGQERARGALARAIAAGRVAHAYLLAGPEGVGKRTFADHLARALLCGHGGEGSGDPAAVGACGRCASCAVPLASHPGYRLLAAPAEETIEIDAVRATIAALSLRSGSRRAVVIDGAEQLGEAAANAFLKTLEEPPPGIVFLLVSSRPAHLLETIRSRAQRVPFFPLDAAAFAAVVALPAGLDLGALLREPGALHRICDGSPGRAARLLAGIEACGGVERFLALLDGVGGERPGALVDYLPALPKETARGRVHRLLDLVLIGLGARRGGSAEERGRGAERALLVAEMLRGVAGGRSNELTLEVLARTLRTADPARVARRLPASFFASG